MQQAIGCSLKPDLLVHTIAALSYFSHCFAGEKIKHLRDMAWIPTAVLETVQRLGHKQE